MNGKQGSLICFEEHGLKHIAYD